MRACRTFAALAALTGLVLSAPAVRAAYQPLEEIPVESPVYGMVEELATSHGFGSAFLATRPWDRADLGRFLDQLVHEVPAAAADPVVVRLRRELSPSGSPGGWEALASSADEVSALEFSPYLRADFYEDRARHAVVRDFRVGGRGALALGGSALLAGDVYAGTNSPGPHGNPTDSRRFGLVEGVELNSYFDRGTATLRGRLGRLVIGHTWLRWGPGAWGSMALSDGAPAFDVLEARVPILRRAQLEWFVASLDPAVQSYLAGHRIELRPTDRWDVALSELARFDGAPSAPLYLLPVVPFSHVEKRILKSSDLPSDSLDALGKNNLMVALDGAWRPRRDLRIYGELAIDDVSFSSEKRPRALAWQVGFVARCAPGARAWTLRGEYSRVYAYTYSVWHHHDFEFAGMPTGFPLGPDVERVNSSLALRPSPDWSVALEGAFTRKGAGRLGDYYVPGSGPANHLALTGVIDADARGALRLDWSPAPGLEAGATAGWASVTARGHVAGADASGTYGQGRFSLRW